MYWVNGRCYGHCGRWNSHIGLNIFDYGRCYYLCGRRNGHWVNCFIYLFIFFYFILSSEVLNRTSSHMWSRWYLPLFLFRDGFLTLMYIASFISLMRLLVFPPYYTEVFQCISMTCGVKMVIYWGRGFQVSFKTLLFIPPCIPPCHIWICIWCHSSW